MPRPLTTSLLPASCVTVYSLQSVELLLNFSASCPPSDLEQQKDTIEGEIEASAPPRLEHFETIIPKFIFSSTHIPLFFGYLPRITP